MDRRQREARQLKQDKTVIDHLTSGPLKPTMRAQPPVERAKPRAESTRDEQEARELREALFKRWTSATGGGLADF
jgi:hypothetical protein